MGFRCLRAWGFRDLLPLNEVPVPLKCTGLHLA